MRKNYFSRITATFFMCAVLMFSLISVNLVYASDVPDTPITEEVTSIVEGVVANTSVRPSGQCLENLVVTVSDAEALKDLKAEDFSLAGQAAGWLTSTLHDFTATISEVAVEGNVMTLTIADFTEKYLYVDNYTVTCSSNEALTFTSEKVTSVITPIADEFEQIKEEADGGMDYNLYTPADTSKPQPIVIAFHGYGDNENLYQNKLAVAWADPKNQKERPCYVLAPSVTNYFGGSYRTELYEKVMAFVNEMIEAGKVDADRIYVVGKSFGGAAVYEFSSKYADEVAGAIAMCGATSYLRVGASTIETLVDTPLWIAHATTDGTVGVGDSRTVYDTLINAGSTVVKFKEYTDEEMIEAGVTATMGNHSVEVPVLEDEAYMEWLFAQTLNEIELPFEDVVEEDWYYNSAVYVYENGIMNGKEINLFAPDENLTRAQFATILYRIDGKEEVVFDDVFTDIKDGNWYTDAIIWANSKGIVKGYANSNLFGVNDEITREQMVTMLYRYAGYKGYNVEAEDTLKDYTDAKSVSVFASDAVEWAIAEGIITGISETEIAPQETATRAQCAAIAERFIKKYN